MMSALKICVQRPGFTLAEVLISLSLVAVAVVTTMAIIPRSLKISQDFQEKAMAAVVVNSAVTALANGVVNRYGWPEADNAWEIPLTGRNMQYDLESLATQQGGPWIPLPDILAERLDDSAMAADKEDLTPSKILAEGGQIYYLNPDFLPNLPPGTIPQDSLDNLYPDPSPGTITQGNYSGGGKKLLFGIRGFAQQNALPAYHRKNWPYYIDYPSPPMYSQTMFEMGPASLLQNEDGFDLSTRGPFSTELLDPINWVVFLSQVDLYQAGTALYTPEGTVAEAVTSAYQATDFATESQPGHALAGLASYLPNWASDYGSVTLANLGSLTAMSRLDDFEAFDSYTYNVLTTNPIKWDTLQIPLAQTLTMAAGFMTGSLIGGPGSATTATMFPNIEIAGPNVAATRINARSGVPAGWFSLLHKSLGLNGTATGQGIFHLRTQARIYFALAQHVLRYRIKELGINPNTTVWAQRLLSGQPLREREIQTVISTPGSGKIITAARYLGHAAITLTRVYNIGSYNRFYFDSSSDLALTLAENETITNQIASAGSISRVANGMALPGSTGYVGFDPRYETLSDHTLPGNVAGSITYGDPVGVVFFPGAYKLTAPGTLTPATPRWGPTGAWDRFMPSDLVTHIADAHLITALAPMAGGIWTNEPTAGGVMNLFDPFPSMDGIDNTIRQTVTLTQAFQPEIPTAVGGNGLTIAYATVPAFTVTHNMVSTYAENSLRLATTFAAYYPNDWSIPRPANRAIMMDRPLLQSLLDTGSMVTVNIPVIAGTVPVSWWKVLSSSTIHDGPLGSITSGLISSWIGRNIDPAPNINPLLSDKLDLASNVWLTNGNGALGTGAERQSGFNLTEPFEPSDRARAIVVWSADWQQYDDFETVPSARMDASRYPWLPAASASTINGGVDRSLNHIRTASPLTLDRRNLKIQNGYVGWWNDLDMPSFFNPERRWAFAFYPAGVPTLTPVVKLGAHPTVGMDADRYAYPAHPEDQPTYNPLPTTVAVDLKDDWFVGKYGADRNHNGLLDRGDIKYDPADPSTKAVVKYLGCYVFYDPRLPMTLR